jgi:mutator protein MutT
MKNITVAIAVIIRSGQLLIAQRKPDASFAHYWEFPGGKCEPGESVQACLHREIKEEVGLTIEILRPFDVIRHTYPTGNLAIHPFLCRILSGQPKPIACQQVLWIDPRDLLNYQFPPANESLLRKIMAGPLP